jgi:hypothetical protein
MLPVHQKHRNSVFTKFTVYPEFISSPKLFFHAYSVLSLKVGYWVPSAAPKGVDSMLFFPADIPIA